MSFSSEVKNELCRISLMSPCCVRAEIYGVLLCCNTFTNQEIRIITESETFAQRLPKLLLKAFAMEFDRLPEDG
ncbi:MAG: DNA-binding protein WhiA, partial [Oscillospiraceae bacterium]|nr:DNA-binding protein WhiA [Oscillospiraceae bacterium]